MAINVIELFAGVGGFRIGLERASENYRIVWSNQWEPSTKLQEASTVYVRQFGSDNHSNKDIATVPVSDIPLHDLLVGGFPCQDYSVASTLRNSGGITGKKGVLWWEIYRILRDSEHRTEYLFLENVDRLLNSPASQRGRDFAIILSSLSDLGYIVEWRVINAADYGMPQRRRRTFILAYHQATLLSQNIRREGDYLGWILEEGTIAQAFPVIRNENAEVQERVFEITGNLVEISEKFNTAHKNAKTPFENTGIIVDRIVHTIKTSPDYEGVIDTLGDVLVEEQDVPDDFFISEEEEDKWRYLKGGKQEKRINKTTGFEYNYSEGSMSFPDDLDKPSRTIITGEGGKSPSRFKHVVRTRTGRLRRLLPLELERLNMFPDNHTVGVKDAKRAFLMGNALVVGVIEKIGQSLNTKING